MAKRQTSSGQGVEDAVVGFAEDLGRILGRAQKKADDWINQRKAIAEQLAQIRDTATHYLEQLTRDGAGVAVAARRGRAASSPASTASAATAGSRKRPAKKRSTVTAAQRKAVSERMKRYWAARRKAEGKVAK